MFVITVASFLFPELALDDSPIECNFKGETPTHEKHVANSWHYLSLSIDISNSALLCSEKRSNPHWENFDLLKSTAYFPR